MTGDNLSVGAPSVRLKLSAEDFDTQPRNKTWAMVGSWTAVLCLLAGVAYGSGLAMQVRVAAQVVLAFGLIGLPSFLGILIMRQPNARLLSRAANPFICIFALVAVALAFGILRHVVAQLKSL